MLFLFAILALVTHHPLLAFILFFLALASD